MRQHSMDANRHRVLDDDCYGGAYSDGMYSNRLHVEPSNGAVQKIIFIIGRE